MTTDARDEHNVAPSQRPQASGPMTLRSLLAASVADTRYELQQSDSNALQKCKALTVGAVAIIRVVVVSPLRLQGPKTLFQTLIVAYCGVVALWTGGMFVETLLRRNALETVGLLPRMLANLAMGALFLILPMFFVIVIISSPIFLLLWLLRRRVTDQFAMVVGAVTVLTAFEWAFYQMEWFDVWRHGWPGWTYVIRLVPPSVGFGAAGAIIARAAIARTELRANTFVGPLRRDS